MLDIITVILEGLMLVAVTWELDRALTDLEARVQKLEEGK